MKPLFLLLLTTFVLLRPLGADYQLGEHPLMFVNKAMLPELAAQAYGDGLLAGDYALMKQEADYFLQTGVLKKPTSQWHAPYELLCCGIVYLVERELGNEEAETYARAVVDFWGDGTILSNVGNKHFGYYALVFDWIFDAMTAEERVKLGVPLGGWLYWYTAEPEITLTNGGWLYNQTWGPAHLNVGNTRDGITPKLFVALALSGAGSIHEDACKQFLDSWDSLVPADCIPLFDMMGGVWSESYGHGSYGPTKVIPWAFEAWRTATGKDWFELGTPTSYLKEMNRWAVHLTVPFSDRTAYIDDNSGDFLVGSWYATAPILGARYRDPVASLISASYDRGTWTQSWRPLPWQRFLAYDSDVPTRTPAQEGWPTARLFTGAGHTYMRSGWNNPNATWAFFGAGPFYAGHSRDDEGHFLIAKKGWLVLRAGGMGHNDSDYYSGGSLVFNIVTIYDPDEEFSRRVDPGESALAQGGTKNENDGGMIRRVYTGRTSEGGEYQARGHITAFKHDWKYTYAASDLTDAYSSAKVREVTRQFIYLRGEREFFVIFDRIDARQAEFPKTWFLHIPSQPAVNGTETALTEDHVYSYSGADISTWLSDPAGVEDDVLSSGKSRAFLKTLLPGTFTITRRGGEGHEFWGHPHEPSAQYNHAGSNSNQPPRVPWRLEVESGVAETRDYFLHVLEITDEQDTEMSEVSLTGQDTSLVGVRIASAETGTVEVYFSRHGTLSARVKFEEQELEYLPTEIDTTLELGGRGDLNGDGRVSITDVIYLILGARENPDDESLDFDSDGTCTLEDAVALLRHIRKRATWGFLASAPQPLDLSAGQRNYVWSVLASLGLSEGERSQALALLGPPAAAQGSALQQNSPNPFNPSTTISYSLPEGPALQARVEIFNLRGQSVRLLVDEVKEPGVYHLFWDGTDSQGRDVPSGIYFYRLKAGEQTRVRKMIVLR